MILQKTYQQAIRANTYLRSERIYLKYYLVQRKKALIERLAVSALDRFEYDHEADGNHQRALGLTIADGRFIKQMKKTSRVISMMKGNEKVEDTDVIDSFNFALTAKIGAIGHTALQTAEIIHDIFEEAAS